ncbi:SDR family NAD(P)-dependent oxidoreductase [Paenibacillus protaetiae]|uniref:SDR family NAD(P)-dependent oxidoreductase n=1 Tax=Paenibacillus protaetiae TaxID=2509456 RepID=A0A4P6F9A5_9BACL|nr:SDR family NAD(P)-dependent oxidoreductase [Paenibacillus protaetiae]QAY67058.1 SDR family NAD(P)-dependent oxidoreductase [Paenibacillus protaetiae]
MDKIACVTGADRGLGFALALQLARAGYRVFAGRYMPDWHALDEAPPELASRIAPIPLDVASGESVERAAQLIADRAGHIDLLINNAGIAGGHEGSILGPANIDFGLVRRIYEVNAMGPLRVTSALSGLLAKGSGKIVVNISSEAGQINQTWREGWYGYCMSKAALNVQTNIMHNELRKLGGKALAVHPGWMKTYMGGERNENAAIEPEEAAESITNYIQGYIGETAERAHPPFVDYTGAEMPW